MNPLFVKVHGSDNVAIIVNPEGVAPGARFDGGLEARESVPQSHKITLARLPAGAPVVRYGEVIGHVDPQGREQQSNQRREWGGMFDCFHSETLYNVSQGGRT